LLGKGLLRSRRLGLRLRWDHLRRNVLWQVRSDSAGVLSLRLSYLRIVDLIISRSDVSWHPVVIASSFATVLLILVASAHLFLESVPNVCYQLQYIWSLNEACEIWCSVVAISPVDKVGSVFDISLKLLANLRELVVSNIKLAALDDLLMHRSASIGSAVWPLEANERIKWTLSLSTLLLLHNLG